MVKFIEWRVFGKGEFYDFLKTNKNEEVAKAANKLEHIKQKLKTERVPSTLTYLEEVLTIGNEMNDFKSIVEENIPTLLEEFVTMKEAEGFTLLAVTDVFLVFSNK